MDLNPQLFRLAFSDPGSCHPENISVWHFWPWTKFIQACYCFRQHNHEIVLKSVSSGTKQFLIDRFTIFSLPPHKIEDMGKSWDRTWAHCSSNHSNTLIETIVHKYLTYSLNNLFKKVKRGLEAISMLSFQYKKNGIKAKKMTKSLRRKNAENFFLRQRRQKLA